MSFLRYILLPVQFIYSIIIIFRNSLYNYNIFTIYKANSYVISVGNLKTGGTGKTPLTEYIIRLFNEKKVAILSRGYKRKTSGFILATKQKNSARHIGDENSQLYNKFENIIIGCAENRVDGVQKLLKKHNDINVVILDDAYQHRSLHRDLNILLTEFNDMFTEDQLIPIGNLREHKKEKKRADIIIITKCPNQIAEHTIQKVKEKIKPTNNQKLYFSFIKNYFFLNMHTLKKCDINKVKTHILITGIQSSQELLQFLENEKIQIKHCEFRDHYNFTQFDIDYIIQLKNSQDYSDQLLLTEKDYYRLSEKHKYELNKYFLLICVQINIDFINKDKSNFNNQLLNFENYQTN